MLVGGQIPWNVTPIRETSQTYCLMGRRPMKGRSGQLFWRTNSPFGSLVEYHPITAKVQSRIHQIGKKVLPGLFLGYALHAGGLWKGDVLIADFEELETNGRIGKSTQKDSMRKRWYFQKQGEIYFSNRRWTNQNTWKRSGTENIHLDTAETQFKERVICRLSWRIRRASSTTSWLLPVAGEAINDFFVHVEKLHIPPSTLNHESKLYSPREESFPFPLKYIDVSKNYSYKFGMSSRRSVIGDFWNIDGSRDLDWSLGQVSHNLLYSMKKLLTDLLGPGGD